jgi:hypothetical protein
MLEPDPRLLKLVRELDQERRLLGQRLRRRHRPNPEVSALSDQADAGRFRSAAVPPAT